MPNRALLRLAAVTFLFLFINGCSSRFQQVAETAKLAVLGQPGVTLKPQQIASIPYASMYARQGDGPQAFLILAFAEKGFDKWISVDRVMLVTHKGRLVKVLGVADELLSVSDQAEDPLIQGLTPESMPRNYRRTISWMPGYFSSIEEQSSFHYQGTEELVIAGNKIKLNKFTEDVVIPAFGYRATNTFWIEPHSGLVRKSVQHYAPGAEPITIIQLRPYIGKYS